MARFSSTNTLSSAQAIAGAANSNPVNVEAVRDARILLQVTALGAGTTLDVFVQVSENGTDWFDVKAFNAITATGNYVLPLEEHEMSRQIRLRYAASGGPATATVTAKIEKKFGV